MTSSALPHGWQRVRIGEIAEVTRGASPRPIASDRWFDNSSKVGWVRISDIGRSDGLLLKTTTQRLSADGIARSRYLPPGTLIMSIAATVGLPIITGIPACIHDGFVALQRLRGVDQRFLFYALKAQEDALKAAGQTGSQANVNTEIVNRLEILLPTESEQLRIAECLHDAEQATIKLKGLISKLEAVKQGMMQQLLMGESRLPDFVEPWRQVRLGDVATMGSGGTPPSGMPQYYGGGIPWVSISDMTRSGRYVHDTAKTLTTSGLVNSAATLYEDGVVLYAMYASLEPVMQL